MKLNKSPNPGTERSPIKTLSTVALSTVRGGANKIVTATTGSHAETTAGDTRATCHGTPTYSVGGWFTIGGACCH